MELVMIIIGAAALSGWAMQLITAIDTPVKKNEPQRCGNSTRARCGR